MRCEFGEYGGVNMFIEVLIIFIVMELEIMSKLFEGKFGLDWDFYIYSRCVYECVLVISLFKMCWVSRYNLLLLNFKW